MKLIRKTNLGKCTVPVYDLTVIDNSNYMITNDDIIVHNSGKSRTAQEIFGIDKELQSSFAASGLKSVNSDPAYEAALKKNGIDSKELANIEKNDPELWGKIAMNPDSIREKAKNITKQQRAFYENARLGIIIDGTGDDYARIKKQKQDAENLGYDTYMIFVNTTLEVAAERNQNRDRVLPDHMVQSIWKDVQSNLGKFKGLFGGNFEIVDNTSYEPSLHTYKNKKTGTTSTAKIPISQQIHKALNRFVSKSVQNPIGSKWIATARALKNSNIIK